MEENKKEISKHKQSKSVASISYILSSDGKRVQIVSLNNFMSMAEIEKKYGIEVAKRYKDQAPFMYKKYRAMVSVDNKEEKTEVQLFCQSRLGTALSIPWQISASESWWNKSNFDEMISIMKLCGARLHAISVQVAKEQKDQKTIKVIHI